MLPILVWLDSGPTFVYTDLYRDSKALWLLGKAVYILLNMDEPRNLLREQEMGQSGQLLDG